MIREFDGLTPFEIDLLFKAPILVAILVAGADGTIDKKEIHSAIETTKKRQAKAKGSLEEFYHFAWEDFEDKLKVLIQSYPKNATDRNNVIEKELIGLNSIFEKIDRQFSFDLYGSLKEVSLNIAKSSGGLLGLNSIGDEEIKYVNLPMLKTPGK